jgi:hypothetical protein
MGGAPKGQAPKYFLSKGGGAEIFSGIKGGL